MIGKDELMKYLEEIDKNIEREVTLIAVGGTAMTMLGLKETTKDVDFCTLTRKEQRIVKAAGEKVKDEIRMDLFSEGYIFSVQLQDDYAKMAKQSDFKFEKLTLKILHPVDIIVSKTDRLSERDVEDIKALIKEKRVNKKTLEQRYREAIESVPGKRENFEHNSKEVLELFRK